VRVNRHGSVSINPGVAASMPPPPASLRAPAYGDSGAYEPSSAGNVHVTRSGSVLVGSGTEYSTATYGGGAAGYAAGQNAQLDPLPSVDEMMAQIRAKVHAAGAR